MSTWQELPRLKVTRQFVHLRGSEQHEILPATLNVRRHRAILPRQAGVEAALRETLGCEGLQAVVGHDRVVVAEWDDALAKLGLLEVLRIIRHVDQVPIGVLKGIRGDSTADKRETSTAELRTPHLRSTWRTPRMKSCKCQPQSKVLGSITKRYVSYRS